jgi:hypothetical protein
MRTLHHLCFQTRMARICADFYFFPRECENPSPHPCQANSPAMWQSVFIFPDCHYDAGWLLLLLFLPTKKSREKNGPAEESIILSANDKTCISCSGVCQIALS